MRMAEQSTAESVTMRANAPSSVPAGPETIKSIGSVQIPKWVFKHKKDCITYSIMQESEIAAMGQSAIPTMGIASTIVSYSIWHLL
jgi:hypothetical protein